MACTFDGPVSVVSTQIFAIEGSFTRAKGEIHKKRDASPRVKSSLADDSAQVQFAKLGLLIVDEEHRFGVRQKDKVALSTEQLNGFCNVKLESLDWPSLFTGASSWPKRIFQNRISTERKLH